MQAIADIADLSDRADVRLLIEVAAASKRKETTIDTIAAVMPRAEAITAARALVMRGVARLVLGRRGYRSRVIWRVAPTVLARRLAGAPAPTAPPGRVVALDQILATLIDAAAALETWARA